MKIHRQDFIFLCDTIELYSLGTIKNIDKTFSTLWGMFA